MAGGPGPSASLTDLVCGFETGALVATGVASTAQDFAVFVRDGEESTAPALIVAPYGGRLDGGAWHSRLLQEVQGLADDRALHFDVVGAAAGVSEWEVREEEAGDAAVLGDIAGAADDNGGDTVGFEVTSGQSDGLMADGSDGDEEGDVYSVLLARFEQGGRVGFAGAALGVFGREAVEAGGKLGEAAGVAPGLQAPNGEVGFGVIQVSGLFVPSEVVSVETLGQRIDGGSVDTFGS